MLKYLDYLKEHITSLEDKTVVITGANSGIGFSSARYLAYFGAHVIMACRNENKALKAINKIKEEVKDAKLDYLHYDQASLLAIDDFAKNLIEKYPKIDALVLNAGVYHPKRGTFTKDGLPLTVGTNFVGIYYLINVLKSYLIKQKGLRLILVGSILHIGGNTRKIKEYLVGERKGVNHQYCVSKKMLMTYENILEEEFKNQVIVTAMHPGVASTNIITEENSSYPKIISSLGNKFLHLFANNPDKSSLGIVLLVGKDDIKDGDYLVPRGLGHIVGYPKKVKMPKNHINKKDLVKYSEEIVQDILNKNN